MKIKVAQLKSVFLFVVFAAAGMIASAQPVSLKNPVLTTNGQFAFDVNGSTNVAFYKVYGTNDLTASLPTWPLVAVGAPGQTHFSLTNSSTNVGFYYVTTNYYDTNNPIPISLQEETQAIATKTRLTITSLITPSSIPSMEVTNYVVLCPILITVQNEAYAVTLATQIAGDFTNNYTFDWSLSYDGISYSDAGITGYHTPSLRIAANSMVSSDSQYLILLFITRLADGYRCQYGFPLIYVQLSSVTSLQQYFNCEGQTNACQTCPCQNANLLPATDN